MEHKTIVTVAAIVAITCMVIIKLAADVGIERARASVPCQSLSGATHDR